MRVHKPVVVSNPTTAVTYQISSCPVTTKEPTHTMNGKVYTGCVVATKQFRVNGLIVSSSEVVYSTDEPFVAKSDDMARAKILSWADVTEEPGTEYEVKLTFNG